MTTALRSRSIRRLAITQFPLQLQFWFPIWLIYLLDLCRVARGGSHPRAPTEIPT
jgi:hypothetical protein